jgi:hypothetical protein
LAKKKRSSRKKKEVKEEKTEEKPQEKEEAPVKEEKVEKKKEEMEIEKIKEESAIEKEDEYAIEILGWATAGYDTSKLEEAMKSGNKKKFEREFKKFKKGVEKLEEIKKELEELNIAGVEEEVDKLLTVLDDPYKVKDAEKELEKIKKLVRIKDLEVELDSMMVVEELKPKIMEIKKKLKDVKNLDEIETEIKDLRREFKESYFVAEFIETIEEKPRAVKKIKVTEEVEKTSNPMVVLDLFVFSNSGKFLGHKTARKGKIDKKSIIERLNMARDFVKNEKFAPGVLIKVPKGGETLLLHKGNFVAVGIIISGTPHKLVGKLLKKGVGMIESEDAEAIKNWDGSRASLLHLKKNMDAIMYAAIKLGEEMKK